jgi:hypothetical protein
VSDGWNRCRPENHDRCCGRPCRQGDLPFGLPASEKGTWPAAWDAGVGLVLVPAWSRHDVGMVEPVFPIPAIGQARVQVTATGEWDKASGLDSGQAARQFLAGFRDGPPDAIGVELLWPGPPISFVGVRLDGDRVPTLPDLVDALAGSPYGVEAALLAMTGEELGPVAVAQCGAINAWSLVPPMTLWDGETWRDPIVQLSDRPDLRVCHYPVGLEVGHEHAWYAVEVSQPTDTRHVVDETRLDDLAAAIHRHVC